MLAPIWKRWALTEELRGTRDNAATLPEWRFPAAPEADPVKQIQATKLLLDSRLMSRREAIAARGESIERVDADIASDPHASATEAKEPAQDEKESEDEAD